MTGPGAVPLEELRGRRAYEVQGRSVAPVDTVWPLIGEAHRWKEWSFLDRSDLITVGEPLPDGVGAVRRFANHGIGSREEVVVWDPPHHLGYVILSGFPARHYRADVVLTPDGPGGTGTLVRWSGTFDEPVPGTGRLLEMVLTKLMTRFVTGLTGYADNQADHQADHQADRP